MQFFFRRIRRRLRVTYWSSICVIRNIKKNEMVIKRRDDFPTPR